MTTLQKRVRLVIVIGALAIIGSTLIDYNLIATGSTMLSCSFILFITAPAFTEGF